MDFTFNDKTREYQERVSAFMDKHVYPNEERFHQEVSTGDRWAPTQLMEELKPKAREAGLWNLFLPDSNRGAGLKNIEYAPLAEIMGRVEWASECFNCSAPDTGNMETIERYGSEAQKQEWLEPLLEGKIRSAFAMTEPAVASSDATNIESTIERQGDEYVINGRKWWTSGAGDPRCKIFIFMGKTNPRAERHAQQSMILIPRDTPGVDIMRSLSVFGYDDAPHGHMEVDFRNVRVPASNILLGEGRGFEIAQGRLGPGRIHHCMRLIGKAERALESMCKRAKAARGVRQASVGADGDAGEDRRSALHDRAGAASDPEGGSHDGYGGQQGSAGRDRHDQGGGAEHGLPGDRLGDAGAWRRRCEPGFPPRLSLR